jgi:hypothetical protein
MAGEIPATSNTVASSIVDAMDGAEVMGGEEEMMGGDEEVDEGEIAAAEEMMEAMNANDPAAFARAMKAFMAFV